MTHAVRAMAVSLWLAAVCGVGAEPAAGPPQRTVSGHTLTSKDGPPQPPRAASLLGAVRTLPSR